MKLFPKCKSQIGNVNDDVSWGSSTLRVFNLQVLAGES